MSIRLDPRRLAALKLLAAEAGIRPGELVTAWVEERLDAARAGRPAPQAGGAAPSRALDELAARVDQLTRRLDAMAAEGRTGAEPAARADASGADATTPGTDATPPAAEETAPEPQRRRPGRPRKQPAGEEQPAAEAATPRVPLHEEIVAVIRERGPMTAGEIASAIAERGRYSAPRSNRPLDAATVNSRVSNPAYRALFVRSEGRVGLA